MKFKILFLGIFCFFFMSIIMAQPKIQFEKTTHDFGEIVEGSMAKYDFVFTNSGNQPLVITKVVASCGCTTPTWTTEPILPGKKGFISAGYNSKGRPGAFNKSITVVSNAGGSYVQLFIKGEVKYDVSQNYSAEQLAASPKISLNQKSISLGKVEKGQKIPVNVIVHNSGKNDLIIGGVKSNCSCVSWVSTSNSPIRSGDSHVLKLVFFPASTGNKIEEVTIYSNDLINSQIKFELLAEVVENMEPQSIIKQNNVLKF